MTTTLQSSEHAVPHPVPKEIHCQVATSFGELADIRQEWDAIVESVGGDIYMAFDWCRIWWDHYGAGRRLQVLVFREGARIVGLLPLFVERIWLGPVWIRAAKLVGADFGSALCNPPVQAEWAEVIFERTLERLFGPERCDAVSLGPIAGTYEPIAALRKVCQRHPARMSLIRDGSTGVHTEFSVASSLDDYLIGLGKKTRGNYRRQLRQLEEAHTICLETITDAAAGLREFAPFISLHETQWKAQGKLGHFGDWPRAVAFNEDLVRHYGGQGTLRLIKLTADGQPIMYHYGFEFGRCYFWRLPARAVGSAWDQYGLGNLGIVQKMEMAVRDGLKRIEAGIGHYDYKLKWGGKEFPVTSIVLAANRPSARMRTAVFSRLADLLHLVYYRIWFLRVAPKLPFRRRPLWRLWIRSRL